MTHWESLPRLGWENFAACAGMDRRVWFANGNGVTAKKVCARCFVADDCLAFAIKTEPSDLRYGVFGGMTSGERTRFAAALESSRNAA